MLLINKIVKKAIVIMLMFALIYIAISIFFTVNYPLSYQNFIKKYSDEFNVDPYLVAAIINVESKYDKQAISNKDARGLMQITPVTARWASEVLGIENFDVEMLFIPETNIMIGTWYLSVLCKEFDNNLQLVLAAYNAGIGNVGKWLMDENYSEDGKFLREIPFTETEEYIDKVEKNIRIYKILYEKEFESESLTGENYLVLLINNFRKVIKSLAMYK